MSSTRRSWAPLVAALCVLAIALLAVLVVALRGEDDEGPGEAAAQALAEDYVEALDRGDCSEYEYLTDGYLEEHDTSEEQCIESLEFEPSYFVFELEDVRVDGDRGEIEFEAGNDVGDVTMIATLVVVDGEWKVDDRREVT
jgi:hypothetical protein